MAAGAGAILGVSADYHDASAALVIDGRLVAAAEQERFSRRKHDPSLPIDAIAYCLEEGEVRDGDLAGLCFYDKPLTAYERVLVTNASVGPVGVRSLAKAVSLYSRSKLWVGFRLERALRSLGHRHVPRVVFAEHHQSHAAAAFYPSPFERAAIITFDGVGEWATTSIALGEGNRITSLVEQHFPSSIGLLYSAMTAFCGFEVNDGEYKLMGLAPYGEPRYADALREHVVHVADDGSIRLDQRWFAFRAGERMVTPRLATLLDGPPRPPESELTQREADLARSTQVVLEDIVLAVAGHAHDLTGARAVCLAGGVALNCVANARLLADGPFDDVWVQPAAGDSGSAVGAAFWAFHQLRDEPREPAAPDGMSGCFLGPAYPHDEIAAWLRSNGISFEEHGDLDALAARVSESLDEGAVVGWFRGRMEFGPRSLGHRSILADPRDPAMVSRINRVVKLREGFRPFAPAVLAEHAHDWFDVDRELPYMLFTASVAPHRRATDVDVDGEGQGGGEGEGGRRTEPQDDPGARARGGVEAFAARLAMSRSDIPACTHLDHSARVQTVDAVRNGDFHALLRAFHDRTGCPVLLNTSFNRRGEPIVRTPADALRCFGAVDLDLLVLEGCVVTRADVPDALDLGRGPTS